MKQLQTDVRSGALCNGLVVTMDQERKIIKDAVAFSWEKSGSTERGTS